MNVVIHIHYIANDIGVLRRGSFPLKRRKPEKVAYDWWKEIKRESFVNLELEKIVADGENITELVKELERAPLD